MASTYIMDNGNAFKFVATQTDSNRSRILFFSSGDLPAGKHTLLVTNQYGWLGLDSFLLKPGVEKDDSISAGAIVGATLGSLALVLFMILGFFYWKRKRGSHLTWRVRPVSPDNDGVYTLSLRSRSTLLTENGYHRLSFRRRETTYAHNRMAGYNTLQPQFPFDE